MLSKRWLSFVAIACLSFCVLVTYIYTLKYQAIYKRYVEQVIETSKFQLQFTGKEFERFESQVYATVVQLKKNTTLAKFISESDPYSRHQLEQVWTPLIGSQQFFKQISYVDITGLEQVKVEYSHVSREPVTSTSYENIGDNYYFQRASQLDESQVASLGISLEPRYTSGPELPTQHIFTPYELDGERVGYLVLNIDIWLAATILDFSPYPQFTPRILTATGDYAAHPDPNLLFGFALPERKQHGLGITNPELWKLLHEREFGSWLSDEGDLYVYKRLQLGIANDFYALIHFNQQQLALGVADEYKTLFQNAALFIVIFILMTIPSAYFIYQQKKRSLDSKLALAALNGMSAVLICDSQYRMIKVNTEFEKMTGYPEGQIRYGDATKILFSPANIMPWSTIKDVLDIDNFWQGELKIKGRAGVELTAIVRIEGTLDSHHRITNYIVSLVDISRHKELEERLRYLSERDELSQLWNRRKFEQELRSESLLVERYPDNHLSCLALIDIDNFKRINDEQGHDAGDRVIKRVAYQLEICTRRTDFVARIGGEEFAIILRHTSTENALVLLERLRVAVSQDASINATISIGLTDLTAEGSRSYKCADVALYDSKALGRNQTSVCRSSDGIA